MIGSTLCDCLFVWPCVHYCVSWLSVVFYRAKVEPPLDVAFQPSDSTPLGDDAADTASSPSSSIRTRKLFPETWLWENVHVTGYPFFQSTYAETNFPSVSLTHTHDASLFFKLIDNTLVMDFTNKQLKAFFSSS